MELGSDSVFLITGAAGSIVSAITADLATASGGTFHLLDLAAAPDADDPELQRYLSDPDSMKPYLAEQITARGDKATPVLIERELARFERLASALSAIQAVTAAGGTAQYHCVDLRDGEAVAAIVERHTGASTSCCTRPGWRSARAWRRRSARSSSWCSA
jgi:NAD(P)-dependent dehydrogenase (short-subunit alcohol dehydrogenase family)